MKKKQDYSNHIFYYWPHHFVFYAAIIIAFALSGVGLWLHQDQWHIWAALMVAIFLILYLGVMTRQHYALGNQDRTVRLELRLRYYILTGKRLEEVEDTLSFKQLAALRFASDEELPALLSSTVRESLNPDEIKKRIRHWRPDTMRV